MEHRRPRFRVLGAGGSHSQSQGCRISEKNRRLAITFMFCLRPRCPRFGELCSSRSYLEKSYDRRLEERPWSEGREECHTGGIHGLGENKRIRGSLVGFPKKVLHSCLIENPEKKTLSFTDSPYGHFL